MSSDNKHKGDKWHWKHQEATQLKMDIANGVVDPDTKDFESLYNSRPEFKRYSLQTFSRNAKLLLERSKNPKLGNFSNLDISGGVEKTITTSTDEKKLHLPYNIWYWRHGGVQRCTIRMVLVSGSEPKDYKIKIMQGGDEVYIKYFWCKELTNYMNYMESYIDPYTGICKYTQDHKKIEALREAIDLEKGTSSDTRLFSEMRIPIEIEGGAEEQFSNDEGHSGVDFTRKGGNCILTLELKGKVTNFQVYPSSLSFRDVGCSVQQRTGTGSVRSYSRRTVGGARQARTRGGVHFGCGTTSTSRSTNIGATNFQASQAPTFGTYVGNGGMASTLPNFNFRPSAQNKKFGRPKTTIPRVPVGQRAGVQTNQTGGIGQPNTQTNAQTNAQPNTQPYTQPYAQRYAQPNPKQNAQPNPKQNPKPNPKPAAHVVPPPVPATQALTKNPPPSQTNLIPASGSTEEKAASYTNTALVTQNSTNHHYATNLSDEQRQQLQDYLNHNMSGQHEDHRKPAAKRARPNDNGQEDVEMSHAGDVEMKEGEYIQDINELFRQMDAEAACLDEMDGAAGKHTVGLMKYVYTLKTYTAILRNSNRTL